MKFHVGICRAWVMLLSISPAHSLQAQGRLPFPSPLSLDKAVSLAAELHPSIRAARASVQSSSASLTIARSGYMPVVAANASASRTEGVFVFNPSIPSRNQSYDNYTGSLSVQQILYDFGKTGGRVSGAEDLVTASHADLETTQDNVIANVAIAYYGVLQAQKIVDVNVQTLMQAQAHLEQAKGYYASGTRPQFDVTKAQVDVANANVNLIRARNQLMLAHLQLENAIGVHSSTTYALSDTLGIPSFTMSLDSVKAIALESRPDLQSARARVQGNEALVSAAWSQHLPSLSLTGNYSWSGFDLSLMGRWTAGLTFSLPLFQGLAIGAQVDQAQANLESARASLSLASENAMLDIEQAYYSLKEAWERIDATAKLIEQAQENLKTAEGRYNFGIGSAIEITDAQTTLSTALTTNVQALYDYNSSLVRLRRAMGVLTR